MYLIKAVKIIDSTSPYHGQQKDILINEGRIFQIADVIDREAKEVIEGQNLHVSAGWIDLRVHPKEPGYEYKESLEGLSQAAMRGGFTEITLLPNTKPVVQAKEALHYLCRISGSQLVTLLPTAAVTLKAEGHDFTDMIDLLRAGAVAFTDGEHPLWHSDILLKTLQYLGPHNGLLMNRPEDTTLSKFGQMNEGLVSTYLGLKGIPNMAEEIAMMRDLKLLEYVYENAAYPTDSRLHFSLISTETSVQLIREAKTKGLPVSCDVAVHQLIFDDSVMDTFDTNYKVNPPFRSRIDIEALWRGLADGTIDAIVSDHNPHDEEAKNLEFDLADFGVIGLETAFAALNTHNKVLSLEQLIQKLTTQPRRILRLPEVRIAEGEIANLTVFDPAHTWVYQPTKSVAKNSPFIGHTLKGKAMAVLNKGRMEVLP